MLSVNMIYHINGQLKDILKDSIIIEANGVGYEIIIPASYIKTLPEIESTIKFYTYHHIREDQQTLFGFSNPQEKDFFLKLTSVSGVGPKVGIKIMSELSINEVTEAILSNNTTTLTRVSGVGKKMAERLVMELKDKCDVTSHPQIEQRSTLSRDYEQDLYLALKTLGYTKEEIRRGISASNDLDTKAPIEKSIKSILKHL
ncbi:Holliday junction branch migration protein RuvA [Candidatus Marinamargulisbacteria bacterium SCGC AG-343-D04]|nr:Holliday junction branch migration protein RuvA [Candidatus Marinamargulisbacteria bacterium SCGC AG-343-D04]